MSLAAAIFATPDPEQETVRAVDEILTGHAAIAIARLEAIVDGASSVLPRYWLSAAYGAVGDVERQRNALRRAQTDHSAQIIRDAGGDMARLNNEPAYAEHVATQLYRANLMGAASLAFGLAGGERASQYAVLSYGLALQHQGRIDEAIRVFEFAAEAFPKAEVHAYLLYACFFSENGVVRHAAEVRKAAQAFGGAVAPAVSFTNARDANRRLRIGYVAPSFVGTQVRQYFLPVLEHHDPAKVEIFLYPAAIDKDAQLPAAKITAIGALSDADACARIRADKIDVLIDLWGHTAKGRLGVFALRAAPVQAAWINYVQSTGIAAMDYVLHCDCMDAPGTPELFTEKIWSLGPILAPFRPDALPDESPTPALKNGFITFGCFNHPAKINDAVVAAWSRILRAIPNSRLILKYSYYDDPVLQNTMCVRFAAHGVPPAQLEFRGHTKGPDYLKEFADIDLALDPSPCPGGTTSSEAVASGVPLLVLRGEDFYARISGVHVIPLGLDELLAETWDDYVARAVALTSDLQALDALRKRVRVAFAASPSRDEAGFTRGIESAFRAMFETWANG